MELPEHFPTELGQLGLLQRAQQHLTKPHRPLREDDSLRIEQPTDLMDECRPRFHQPLPDPMEGLEVMLGALLDGHEAHCRPGDSSPIASASAISFLFDLTYGLTT
jgi:hypothetical protein